MKDSFDWDLLRSFLVVARTGRLTAAARAMKLDHSTLSRRMYALEKDLGVTLFDRRLSGYPLTTQGERLLARAEEIESGMIGIQSAIAGDDAQVAGTVRIGAPDGFGTAFLAPRIGALCARHPGLEIELVATPRSFSLSKREADIGIGLSAPKGGRHHARRLTDYELGLYAAPGMRGLAEIEAPADLTGRSFVGYIDDLIFTPELDYLSSVSRDVSARLRSSNLIAQMNAAAAGAGLCVLPCFLARARPDLVRVLPAEVKIVRAFWMVVHSDMRQLSRIRATADFIAEEVRRAGDFFGPGPG